MTRVLQFSDLHFRQALPGHSGHAERLSRHGPALLAALAERIAAEEPDVVAFTGDIIDAPHDLLHGTAGPDLQRVLGEAVRADYRTMRAWLDGLGRPWMIAPGNHDFRPLFEEVFGDAPRRLTLGDTALHAYFDWEVRDNTAERLHGERERFERALAEADPAGWTVHLQHFLIWPVVPHGYPMRYREADDLRDRLAAAEAPHLVLCGHFHEGTGFVELGSTRFAVCPSTTEPPHRYRVFDLAPNSAAMREETLAPGPLAGERVLLVDRADFLTEPRNGPDGGFALQPGAAEVFRAARAAGFLPAVLSVWNDDLSLPLAWGDLLKKHDRLFLALGEAGIEQGGGLVIAIDGERALPGRMPSEPILRLAGLMDGAAARFGIPAGAVWRLSRSAPAAPRILADIEALAALRTDA